MVRFARSVVKYQPQHIIQRGNNKDVSFAHWAAYQYYPEYLTDVVSPKMA
jgi:hypothetical protein